MVKGKVITFTRRPVQELAASSTVSPQEGLRLVYDRCSYINRVGPGLPNWKHRWLPCFSAFPGVRAGGEIADKLFDH